MTDSGQTCSRFRAQRPGEAKQTGWFLWQPAGAVLFMKRRHEQKRGRRQPRARRQPRREPPRIVLQGPFCSAGLPISQNKDIPARRLPDRSSCSPELSAGRDLVCRLEGAGEFSLCRGSCFPGGPKSGHVETRGKAKVTASHPLPRTHTSTRPYSPSAPAPRLVSPAV